MARDSSTCQGERFPRHSYGMTGNPLIRPITAARSSAGASTPLVSPTASVDDGVTVPAHLGRKVAWLAWLGAEVASARSGGLPLTPELARVLDQLDMSARRQPFTRMAVDEARWVTTIEAAALAGVSDRSVQRLAASGRLIARRHGRRGWLIDSSSARDYGRERGHAASDDHR